MVMQHAACSMHKPGPRKTDLLLKQELSQAAALTKLEKIGKDHNSIHTHARYRGFATARVTREQRWTSGSS